MILHKKGSIFIEPFFYMKLLSFTLLFFSFHIGCSQTNRDIHVQKLKQHIHVLANDSLFGRAAGSVFEEKALDYIQKEIKKKHPKKCKLQPFHFQYGDRSFQSKNGYVFLNNRSKETIIIGAHYDHIGLGGNLSSSLVRNEIHNGADDNASGVALMLNLIDTLTQIQFKNYNLLFVFYGAHEVGLFGSQAFEQLTKSKRRFQNISFVLNFDMVGRLNNETKFLKCYSNLTEPLTFENLSHQNINLQYASSEKLAFLDTKWFHEKGIPCLSFTTGMHSDYHKTSDDSEKINFQGIYELEIYIINLLQGLPSL
jgi:Peptidase family M28